MMLKTILDTGLDVNGRSGEELSLFIAQYMG